MMRMPGWTVWQENALDMELVNTMEQILMLDHKVADFSLKYAYLRGTLDFIRRLYQFEEDIRSYDKDIDESERKRESFIARLRDKFRQMYFYVIAKTLD